MSEFRQGVWQRKLWLHTQGQIAGLAEVEVPVEPPLDAGGLDGSIELRYWGQIRLRGAAVATSVGILKESVGRCAVDLVHSLGADMQRMALVAAHGIA